MNPDLSSTSLPPIPLTRTRPWGHQLAAYHFAHPKRAAMLGMEMGTGKSKVVVDLVVNRRHQRTLILCPLSVIEAWEKQFALHAGAPVRVVPLNEGTVAERMARAKEAYETPRTPTAFLINYEAARLEPFATFAQRAIWDLVVCDESHRIKAPAGAVSRFVRSLTKKAGHRLCLTGTPMAHSPLDLWGQFCFLAPWVFGRFRDFRTRYAILGGYLEKQVIGFQNTEQLYALFAEHAFQAKASEVLDLPEAVHTQRTCVLSSRAQTIYRGLEKDFWAAVGSGEVTINNALTKLLRLQQVTSGYVATDAGVEEFVDGSKRAVLADTLEDLPPFEPIIVFARFRHDLRTIQEVAKEQGRSTAELSGTRNELRAWQDGQREVLAVQIQSGGVGIDLTRARYCIYYSLGFSLADYLQSLARCHRPGQTRSVNYIHLLARSTVDQQVYRALEKRQQVVEAILAGRQPQTLASTSQAVAAYP